MAISPSCLFEKQTPIKIPLIDLIDSVLSQDNLRELETVRWEQSIRVSFQLKGMYTRHERESAVIEYLAVGWDSVLIEDSAEVGLRPGDTIVRLVKT